MSSMYAQFYAHTPWKDLPIFALLLFFSVFAAVVLKFVVFTSRDELDDLARLALDPSEPVVSEVADAPAKGSRSHER